MSRRTESLEVFFELTRLEDNLRVCAVDSITGIEVITILPAKTSKSDAQKIALKKLLWRLNQQDNESSAHENGNAGVEATTLPPKKYL